MTYMEPNMYKAAFEYLKFHNSQVYFEIFEPKKNKIFNVVLQSFQIFDFLNNFNYFLRAGLTRHGYPSPF